MKFKIFSIAILFSALLFTACDQGGAKLPKAEGNIPAEDAAILDSASYVLGVQIGNFLNEFAGEINMDVLLKGYNDVISDTPDSLKMVPEGPAMGRIMTAFEELKVQKMQEAGLEEAEKFLEENAAKEGIQTTESGLQYEIITEGEGDSPAAIDTVKVHYEGTDIDGNIFDSSIERGKPVEFPLNGVIPGWTEGVSLMKPGAKYRFYIHPDMAYGVNGRRDMRGNYTITPNQLLIFEIELLDFKKGTPAEPAPAPQSMQ